MGINERRKTKYTPSPWLIAEDVFDKEKFLDFCESVWDATQSNGNLSDTFKVIQTSEETGSLTIAVIGNGPQSEGNSKLIASAPELLRMLDKTSAYIARGSDPASLLDEIAKVMSKATGVTITLHRNAPSGQVDLDSLECFLDELGRGLLNTICNVINSLVNSAANNKIHHAVKVADNWESPDIKAIINYNRESDIEKNLSEISQNIRIHWKNYFEHNYKNIISKYPGLTDKSVASDQTLDTGSSNCPDE